MIQGPSVGPAMLLNVLMRWPSTIVVCALAGAGALVYDKVDAPQYIDSMRQLATQYGIMKTNEVVEAAKKVEVIPTAIAAPMVHDSSNAATITVTAEEAEELSRLRRIHLEPRQVAPVRVGE